MKTHFQFPQSQRKIAAGALIALLFILPTTYLLAGLVLRLPSRVCIVIAVVVWTFSCAVSISVTKIRASKHNHPERLANAWLWTTLVLAYLALGTISVLAGHFESNLLIASIALSLVIFTLTFFLFGERRGRK